MLISKEIKMKVIGKTQESRGFFFKRNVYIIALQMIDETAQNPYKGNTVEREFPFHQYCQLNEGRIYMFTMWTIDNRFWYFSEEEAKLTMEL